MKYILVLFIVCTILSCKKENGHFDTIPPPDGASNIIEGDIIWGGDSTTHFINHQAENGSIYAYFDLDTPYSTNTRYGIRITGIKEDTIVSFSILNPNLNTPGVYNFQDLDSNHFVSEGLQTGYVPAIPPQYPPMVSYAGISYSNAGRLTIDTISENHISGNIDAYCNRQGPITNILDTNEVHLLFHFSGDLRRD